MALERFIDILRQEHNDATREVRSADQRLAELRSKGESCGLTEEEQAEMHVLSYKAWMHEGRKVAVNHLVDKLNEEYGTDYQRGAQKPRKKRGETQE